MTPRWFLLAPLAALTACTCASELPVGALPEDGGDSADATATDGSAPVTRPCGVPERRFTALFDIELMGGSGRAVVRGRDDDLYVAYGWNDLDDAFWLGIYGVDVTTEATRTIAVLPVDADLLPYAMRFGDAIDVLLLGSTQAEWVRVHDDGRVERFDVERPGDLFDVVPSPRGFIARGESRLFHLTLEGVEQSSWEETRPLHLYANEADEEAYIVLEASEGPPVIELARVPAADPVSSTPSWVEVFRADAGGSLYRLEVHVSNGAPVLSWWSGGLRVHWLDDDGRTVGRWSGADGFLGFVSIVGDAPRASLYGWMVLEERTGSPDSSFTHASISGPGEVHDLRVISDVRSGLWAPHDTWITKDGGHAAALVLSSQAEVVVTCEGAE